MKALTKTAVAMSGGVVAVVLTVGFGGSGLSPAGGAGSTTQPSSSLTQALPKPKTATPERSAGIHIATLTGCVSGLDC